MSFANTHTPLKPTAKAKYQLPMVAGKCGTMTYLLEGDLRERFIRYFPNHTNREMMTLFGISFSTMQRFKRELELQHNKIAIIRKQAEITKRICEENGYYDSLRGKAPSEKCIAATKAKRGTGWHPLDEVRKDKRKYNNMMKRWSKKRNDTIAKERMRVDYGLPRRTRLHIPFVPYNKAQIHIRYICKQNGYVLGNKYSENERMYIYYNEATKRNSIIEMHGNDLHFTFLKQTTS